MTIRGFRSLLEKDKGVYTKKIILKDTKLIVDGDNFIIEYLSSLNDDQQKPYYRSKLYSSDMVSYAKGFIEVCQKLKRCGISPIFVFSGAIPNEGIAEEGYPIRIDNQERTRNCLKSVTMDLDESKTAGSSACSILLKSTSKTLLDDMGFERRRRPFLCDKYICNLSFEMKCPIISSDSDYILMDSYQGFIMNKEIYGANPIEIVDDITGEVTGLGLECAIYSQENLLNYFPGLKKQLIPLFGAMFDSSYLKTWYIDLLTSSFHESNKIHDESDLNENPDSSRCQFPAHKKILNVFKFLSKFDDPNTALEAVIERIDKRKLHNSYKSIRIQEIHRDIISRLKVWSLDDPSLSDAKRCLQKYYPQSELETIAFILDNIYNDNISSKFTNIIFKTTQFERPYIEMLRWVSPNILKKRIYSIVLALVRPKSLTKMSKEEKNLAAKHDVSKIYDRFCKKELVFMCSVPLSQLTKDINLDDYDIQKFQQLKREEALAILLGAFYCDKDDWIKLNKLTDTLFEDTFSYNAAVCLLMLKYVAIESKMMIKNLIDAILLTLIFHALERSELRMEKELEDKEEILSSMKNSLDKIEDPVAKNKFPDEFYETTHMISMFNVALWGFINLNSIIKQPMGTPRPELFIDGRIIYMFYRLSSSTASTNDCIYPEFTKDRVEKIKSKLDQFIPTVKRQFISPLTEHVINFKTKITANP